jgi:hypothetical protein
MAYHLKVICLL